MNILTKTLIIASVIFSISIANAQQYASVKTVNDIVKNYLAIKNSLVADDAAAAAHSAKELLENLSPESEKALKPEQRKILNRFVDKLKYDSRHISEVSMIDHQREHFASLSKNLYEVLKGLRINTASLYEEYCPMKKAYWLSEAQTIKNPYYGKKMPECGRVAETLVPVTK